ncbi:MAG TPA: hypothetical protein VFX51_08270 [Solirubrobacteraceae bacterium]|nr:hypothetical protein [Solirubrobacteraceae bacterium]
MRSLVDGRGACTDAERRAALALHDELRSRGHEAWVETQWVRPQWALALALGALLSVAGSLLSTASAVPGLVLAVLGAATIVARPFPRRATQNVLTGLPEHGVVLAIAAGYDVPRRGLVSQRLLRSPGPLVCAALVVAATAARVAGSEPGWLGAVQLVPTIALMIVVAAAIDVALSGWADSDGAAAAVALTVFDELSRETPRALRPALLLVGAADARPRAAARQLRREGLNAERVMLLQLVDEEPFWATRHPQIRAAVERALPALGLGTPERRMAPTRLPTIRVGCADRDAALDLALGVIDALDADLSARAPAARPRARPSAH